MGKRSAREKVRLREGDRIVAVVPEFCRGPGWSNAPMWVYVQGRDQSIRAEVIQPQNRTAEMSALFAVGAACAVALREAVEADAIMGVKRGK